MKFVDMANVSYWPQNLRGLLLGVQAGKLKFSQKSGIHLKCTHMKVHTQPATLAKGKKSLFRLIKGLSTYKKTEQFVDKLT